MQTYSVLPWNAAEGFLHVPALAIDHLQWSPQVDISAGAQLCWEPGALHVRLFARESAIRAAYTGLTDMVCEDSCLEFFLRPLESDMRYFNFEFNKNCALYLGFGADRYIHARLLVGDAEALFSPRSADLPDGWEITYRIPAEFIARFFPGFALARGQRLMGNFYKCGDLTPQPHYLSWSPLDSETPEFHRPQDFGLLTLL